MSPHSDSSLNRRLRKFAATLFARSPGQSNCSRAFSSLSTAYASLYIESDSESDTEPDHFVCIMGKSNKFDYTNRTNGGAKLGRIVGRDLEKEADRAKKDADKIARRARKMSTGSISSAVSSSDTKDTNMHTLDIKIPGKQLGDEGACAMFDGLENALRKGDTKAYILVEDLNLANNALTTKSLLRLAPIIDLARYDLKSLDLSRNDIKVNTAAEVAEWEAFLRAFGRCLKLRRLDLSGNRDLGSKAMEVFARVYTAEKDIGAIPLGGRASVHSLGDEADCLNQETPTEATFTDYMTDATLFHRRCGLRSLPYLTLDDIGLTDAGAVWLSYVIEAHYYPDQLIDELNATHTGSTTGAYQQAARSSGLEWDVDEPGLSRDGRSLLGKAEGVRRRKMMTLEGTSAALQLIAEDDTNIDIYDVERLPRTPSECRHVKATKGDRRTSLRSIDAENDNEHDLLDLESARRKAQRAVLQQHGSASVELWRISLRIVIAAQILSGLVLNSCRVDLTRTEGQDSNSASRQRGDTANRQASGASESRISPRRGLGSHDAECRQYTYAATLAADGDTPTREPDITMTDVTDSLTPVKMVLKPYRKCGYGVGGQSRTPKFDILDLQQSEYMDRCIRWQEEHMASVLDRSFISRNSTAPSGRLPLRIVERIACATVSEQERSLLSRGQCRDAVAWGVDRKHFVSLKEWRKMADSAQVWTLLESIGCLVYRRE